jgi:integrase
MQRKPLLIIIPHTQKGCFFPFVLCYFILLLSAAIWTRMAAICAPHGLIVFASTSRNPRRNRLSLLLSLKAGLRAGEIAKLTWDMVVGPTGEIGSVIELARLRCRAGAVARAAFWRGRRGALPAQSHFCSPQCLPRNKLRRSRRRPIVEEIIVLIVFYLMR